MCSTVYPAPYAAGVLPFPISPAGHPGEVTIEDAGLGKIVVTPTGECSADVRTEDGLTFNVTASNKRALLDAIDRALAYKAN